MKTFRRADKLEIGDLVLFHGTHPATVVAVWPNNDKPSFTLLALKNETTQHVAELSVLNSVKFEILMVN